ncbi:MAG: ADP-ribosylglycohydrolase family protein [Rothia sp. (in: high G+C Gram-positive bacteria)]|nr:ADP-ribosylglycohydrolase family protein [Rothia sp. (in: high G+C Gram-positive bacteria)]
MTFSFPAPSALCPVYASAVCGALWGCALGDSLGYPVETLSTSDMLQRYGVENAQGLLAALSAGSLKISDDTQLTLYTLDGLSEVLEWNNEGQAADELACIWLAYLRWYRATGNPYPDTAPFMLSRPLDELPAMAAHRHPGKATLAALATGEMQFMAKNVNPQALGTGALVRSAVFGFLPVADDATVIKLSAHAAALTHGHPEAVASASAYALLVRYLLASHQVQLAAPGRSALEAVLAWAQTVEGKQTLPGDAALTIAALETALSCMDGGVQLDKAAAAFGDLWLAPGVLGFGAYLLVWAEARATAGEKVEQVAQQALAAAVAIDGDSDSVAALTGTLLGAFLTDEAFDQQLLHSTDAEDALHLVTANWFKQLGIA